MASIFSDISRRFRNSNTFEKIIILNILVYLLYIILKLFNVTYINEYFALTHDYLYNPWSILTYAFIHEGLYELIFMMILIYYSSSSLINLYGEKIPIRIFFTGIILGGLFFLVFFNQSGILIGSSAGVYALLFFMFCFMPNKIIKISFIKFEFKYLMFLFFFMDIIRLFASNNPDGGAIAHIGGYLAGFYYYISLYGLGDYKKYFSRTKKSTKKHNSSADFSKQKKIDLILDKISKSGYDNLTKSEKEFLFKAGKK
ncbi:MAG: rhomboid family intramembrane serine protease [Flavobacteriaceae bacterium]|nr:rhomboid family intramembrane serine protease [Flavobacteriaceae bacterium]